MEQNQIAYSGSTSITALTFLLATILVMCMSAGTIFVFNRIGANQLLSGAIAASYFTAIKYLHEKFEKLYKTKKEGSQKNTDATLPTISFKRMIFYAPMVIFGYYAALMILSLGNGAIITPWLIEKGLSLITIFIISFATSSLLGLFIPISMYLIGEWIGRRMAKKSTATVVAWISAFLSPFILWLVVHILIDTNLLKQSFPIISYIDQIKLGWAILMILNFLTIFVPLRVGVYRGAKYKVFFDLAFFSKHLPYEKNEEISEFIQLIKTDYARR